jgi:hypothetical protein
MPLSSQDPHPFTTAQQTGLECGRRIEIAPLPLCTRLESALESAGHGREAPWREEVIAALVVLDEATSEEGQNASRPDSLLSDVARTQPRLRNRVRGVRLQYRQLRERTESFRRER